MLLGIVKGTLLRQLRLRTLAWKISLDNPGTLSLIIETLRGWVLFWMETSHRKTTWMDVKNKRNCVLCYRMPNTKQWRTMCPAKSGTSVSLQDCRHAAKLGAHASLEDGENPVEAEQGTTHSLCHWWIPQKNHVHMPAWMVAEHLTEPWAYACLNLPCKASPVSMPACMLCTLFRNRNGYPCWSEQNTTKPQTPELNSDSSIHKMETSLSLKSQKAPCAWLTLASVS